MNNTKIKLANTLYHAVTVLDRSRLQDPDFYALFEFELDHLNKRIRDVLDKFDMLDQNENSMVG